MIQPVGPRMLVKPLKQEDIALAGDIFIPGSANANLLKGEVLRISLDEFPKDEEGNPLYKIGDVVIHPHGSGVGHREGAETLLWLQFPEIWGLDVPEEPKTKKK